MLRADTPSGTLVGRGGDGVVRFHGIPFAAAPVGPLRFRAPAPVEPWAGPREAATPGPAPMQPRVVGLGMRGAARCSEDCLTVNVVTPALDGGRRPVLLWLFGGAYVNGDGADPLFDGARLAAAQNLVVVTCNYRLGAFGFAALADANCGLADQIAALRWIHDHVAAFGGDPGAVCVAGESAGAMSVCNLLAAPAARGLFHRAIAQSGAADNVADAPSAAAAADMLRATLAHDPFAADAATILRAQEAVTGHWRQQHRTMPFRPWLDGTSLPQPPLAVAATSDVPLVIGMNRDEQRLYVRASLKIDDAGLVAYLERRLRGRHADPGVAARQVLAHYRHTRAPVPLNPNVGVLADVDTELRFRRPLLDYAGARHADTWIYQFDWPSPALRGWLGACHAIEIPFVFGNFDPPGVAKFVGAGPDGDPSAAQTLSREVMARWGHFVRYGRPPPDWPRFDTRDPHQLHLDRRCEVRRLADDPTIDFWNRLLGGPERAGL